MGIEEIFGPLVRYVKGQAVMTIRISVPATPENYNVSVRVWCLATAKKLEEAQKNPALIKIAKGVFGGAAMQNDPFEAKNVTLPAKGFLYFFAEPSGEWALKPLRAHRSQRRTDQHRQREQIHFGAQKDRSCGIGANWQLHATIEEIGV